MRNLIVDIFVTMYARSGWLSKIDASSNACCK